MVKPGGIERAVEFAADKLRGRRGAIFVVMDSDDDWPCELGPKLLQRARNIASGIPTRAQPPALPD